MSRLDLGIAPAVAATGIGSLPGTDPLAASTWVIETLTDVPHLPELPARGLGADAIGRAAALLVDLPVETVPAGWQVAGRPGADLQRARQLLADDLAALEVAAHGWTGPIKVQVLGPVTLAATLGQARGEAALSDPGLRRDLAASLTDGVRGHLADLSGRLPQASLLLQVDEPSLPAALAGTISTRSGWRALAPLEAPDVHALLAPLLALVPAVVHCCAPGLPITLLADAGAGAVSFDLDLLHDAELDDLAAALERGVGAVVGAVPTSRDVTGAQAADRVRRLWRRLGVDTARLPGRAVVTPACGLAGLSMPAARTIYRTAVEAASRLSDDVDGADRPVASEP